MGKFKDQLVEEQERLVNYESISSGKLVYGPSWERDTEEDPWLETATMADIEIMHLRLDYPELTREQAADMFAMKRQMGLLDDRE